MNRFGVAICSLAICLAVALGSNLDTPIQAQGPGGDGNSSLFLPLVSKVVVWDIATNQFGYSLRDSGSDPNLQFNWEAIENTGTEITEWINGEHEIPIGFYFPFYDGEYNAVTLSVYGKLKFDRSFPAELGAFRAFGGLQISGRVYYEHRSDPQRLIITFQNIQFSGDSGPSDFQIILFQSGDILIHYRHLAPLADSKRFIGIEYLVHSDPLIYSRQPADESVVRFGYPAQPNHTYPPDAQRWHTNAFPTWQADQILLNQHETSPKTILLAYGLLIRSLDGGGSWSDISPSSAWGIPDPQSVFAADPTPNSGLMFAGGDVLYRTANGGKSWARVWRPEGLSIKDIAFSPDFQSDGTIYLTGRGRGEGGKGNGFWISNDAGLSWRQSDSAARLAAPSKIHFSTHFRRTHKIWLTSTAGGFLYFSADAGDRWQTLSLPTRNYELAVASDDAGEGDVLFLVDKSSGGDARLWISVDDGFHWMDRGELPYGVSTIVPAADYPAARALYAIGYTYSAAIFRSTDQGRTWEAFDQGMLSRRGYVSVMAEHASTHTLFALLQAYDHHNAFLYRRDPGDVWRLISQSAPSDLPVNQAGYAMNGSNALIVFASRYMTEDEGRTWTPYPSDLTFLATLASPTFAEDGKAWAWSHAYPASLMMTEDGGATWREVGAWQAPHTVIGAHPLAISPDFSEDGLVFTASSEGIFRSGDGGQTWARVDATGGAEHIAVSPGFESDGEIFANVGFSLDRGQTWTSRYLGFIRVSPDYARDSAIYRVLRPDLRTLLQRSVDKGQSWQSIPLPQSMDAGLGSFDLVLSPCLTQHPSMFIGKEGGWSGSSWLSDDGGLSWRWFGAGKSGSDTSHEQTYFYVPETGRLYHLNKYGLWWSQIDWPDPSQCGG